VETRKLRSQDTCRCSAYSFPHRLDGGECTGPSQICSLCHSPCEGDFVDFGIGTTEAWGVVSTHTDVQWVSFCCEAEVHSFAGYEIEPPGKYDNHPEL